MVQNTDMVDWDNMPKCEPDHTLAIPPNVCKSVPEISGGGSAASSWPSAMPAKAPQVKHIN
jgi:hypothetical protein